MSAGRKPGGKRLPDLSAAVARRLATHPHLTEPEQRTTAKIVFGSDDLHPALACVLIEATAARSSVRSLKAGVRDLKQRVADQRTVAQRAENALSQARADLDAVAGRSNRTRQAKQLGERIADLAREAKKQTARLRTLERNHAALADFHADMVGHADELETCVGRAAEMATAKLDDAFFEQMAWALRTLNGADRMRIATVHAMIELGRSKGSITRYTRENTDQPFKVSTIPGRPAHTPTHAEIAAEVRRLHPGSGMKARRVREILASLA